MPEEDFKEWVAKKDDEAHSIERTQRQAEWLGACRALMGQIVQWLSEDDQEGRIQIQSQRIRQNERALGAYDIDSLRIGIGDSFVDVVPISRNVIAQIKPPSGGEFRGAGRVDITDRARKYHLYRIIQDGKDVWYVVNEGRREVTPLSKNRIEEILMDLMS